MDSRIVRLYRSLRDRDWRAVDALRHAKAAVAFADMTRQGLVRLRVEVDVSMYDDSYIDTLTERTQAQRDKERKETWARISSEGVWGIVYEYLDMNDTWVIAYDCWQFTGDDWRESGYDTDGMIAAVDAAREVVKQRAFLELCALQESANAE